MPLWARGVLLHVVFLLRCLRVLRRGLELLRLCRGLGCLLLRGLRVLVFLRRRDFLTFRAPAAGARRVLDVPGRFFLGGLRKDTGTVVREGEREAHGPSPCGRGVPDGGCRVPK